MKNIVLIPLALFALSSQGPMDNGRKKAPNSDADKVFVLVKDWNQGAQGNLTIHDTAKVLIDVQWSSLTEYSGTAYTDYSRGSTILDVGPYNYQDVMSYGGLGPDHGVTQNVGQNGVLETKGKGGKTWNFRN